ncbi:MAG TPA: VOC family protein [Gammaproteobacteria bacterium]|nr:VOC family protein [Gammaproteobacteria bacterium]
MDLEASVSVHFNGDCREALEFYERLLGAKLELVLTWGQTPMAADAPPSWHDKILFARLTSKNMSLVGADTLPGTYRAPTGFNLSLATTDLAETERYFAELARGGVVHQPLGETFWALRYGFVTDRFGVPWEITCAKPQ